MAAVLVDLALERIEGNETMNTYASRISDGRYVRDAEDSASLRCSVHRCPNEWTTSIDKGRGGSQRLCGAHATADPAQWAVVTQRILDRQTDRARDFDLEQPAVTITPEEVVEAKAKLRRFATGAFPPSVGDDWAHELRDRELNHGGVLRSGRQMTQFQREAWRRVLVDRRDVGEFAGEDLTPEEIKDRQRASARRLQEYAQQRGIFLPGSDQE